jgi:hypothetical protein
MRLSTICEGSIGDESAYQRNHFAGGGTTKGVGRAVAGGVVGAVLGSLIGADE